MAPRAKTEANAVSVRPTWAKDLTDREMIFVEAYVRDLNALRAALAAGAPKASAHNYGHDCKNRPHVRAVIDILLKERMSALKMSLAERLAAVALQRPQDYFQWGERKVKEIRGDGFDKDGKPKFKTRTYSEPIVKLTPAKKLDERQLAAVKGVKTRVSAHGRTVELLLHDPMIATQRLAELLGMQQVEQAGGAGHVTFIIEAPDGGVIRADAPALGIDRSAVDAAIAGNAEPDPEDAPPGAKQMLVIETP
jgi:phage terminase small subunit